MRINGLHHEHEKCELHNAYKVTAAAAAVTMEMEEGRSKDNFNVVVIKTTIYSMQRANKKRNSTRRKFNEQRNSFMKAAANYVTLCSWVGALHEIVIKAQQSHGVASPASSTRKAHKTLCYVSLTVAKSCNWRQKFNYLVASCELRLAMHFVGQQSKKRTINIDKKGDKWRQKCHRVRQLITLLRPSFLGKLSHQKECLWALHLKFDQYVDN